jgi:hypothetical protein
MNDVLLKKAGSGNYWWKLLERICDTRSSEKVVYRQVLDLYATSVDYEPHTLESQQFFKVVTIKCTMPPTAIPHRKSSPGVPLPNCPS